MAGRPKANIDWNKVDRLLESGCLITEIAAHFGITRDSLYNRCLTDHNCNFSTYRQEKKAKGESLLRAAQFKKAMSGDNSMLIWLGKQRLDQRDKPKLEEAEDDLIRKLARAVKTLEGSSGTEEVSVPVVED